MGHFITKIKTKFPSDFRSWRIIHPWTIWGESRRMRPWEWCCWALLSGKAGLQQRLGQAAGLQLKGSQTSNERRKANTVMHYWLGHHLSWLCSTLWDFLGALGNVSQNCLHLTIPSSPLMGITSFIFLDCACMGSTVRKFPWLSHFHFRTFQAPAESQGKVLQALSALNWLKLLQSWLLQHDWSKRFTKCSAGVHTGY